jgi:type IV pilus assembly protein PilB
VRRLCSCRREREATEAEKQELGVLEDQPLTICEPVGCQICSHTGYYGRIGVYEMMTLSPALRSAIVKMQPASRIKEIAVSEGMNTLRTGAANLVKQKVTSLEEMRKIAYEED